MATTATPLFAARNANYENANPVAPGAPAHTIQSYKDWLSALPSGTAAAQANILFAYNQVRASATIKDNGLTAADVAGATINGVDATATYATSINNTLSLIKNKINAGGNTPNDLITKAVFARRYFSDGYGYFTHASDTPGTVSPAVDGTTCAFTAVGVNATDAALLATAINAEVTASKKVVAFSDGVDKTYVIAEGTNRATISSIGSLGLGINYGVRINGVAIQPSVGYITVSGSSSGTVGRVTVGGTPASYTAGASDTLTAVAIAAAINTLNKGVYATNAAGVVYIYSRNQLAGITLSATGTGVTVNTATISGASNVDVIDSAALTWAINTNPAVNPVVRAINATSTTIVLVAKKIVPFSASGTGVTFAGPLMLIATGAGTTTATIGGVDTSVTWASSDAATATALTAAINANTLVNHTYVAFNAASGVVIVQRRDGGDQMYAVGGRGTGLTVGGVATPLTTLTLSSPSGTLSAYVSGVAVASITAADVRSSGTLTIATGSGAIGGTIAGILVTVTATGVDATDAAALGAAINANSALSQLVTATWALGVVTITDRQPGLGTSTTLVASGTNVTASDTTLAASDTTWATAFAAAINLSLFARQRVTATSALGVVTVASNLGISLTLIGPTVAVSAPYLTAAGTYGGTDGNALTLTSSGNCTRSGATLANGVTGVVATATEPGLCGNYMTWVAAGAASGHVTASGARLGASPAGIVAAGAETAEILQFA